MVLPCLIRWLKADFHQYLKFSKATKPSHRNTQTKDYSTNIVPWAFFIGGEELHNNHRADPASPKLSVKKWEWDLGWTYIKGLERFGLAKIRTI